MSFSAATARPTLALRLRSRLLGASVGVLVAVGLGATAVPVSAPVTAPVAGPAPIALQQGGAVVPSSGPSSVIPGTATPDRVPAWLGAGEVVTPPPRLATTLGRSEPTRVRIPAIGLDSELVALGLQHDGRMEVPPGAFPAGWYVGAPTPGELGPAVLAGHVDYGGVAGVFHRLRELAPGDPVEVAREDGSTAVFRVTRVEQHPKDAFPTAAVYGDIDHAGLRLITCGGSFDRGAHSYEDNIVVFAELDPGGRA